MTTAFGVIGISPADFWKLSLTEWLHIQRGYFLKEEMASRQQWEIGRMVAFYSVKPHVKRNTMQTIDSLFKFPWEKEKVAEKMTEDDMQYIIRKYGRFYNAETNQFVN